MLVRLGADAAVALRVTIRQGRIERPELCCRAGNHTMPHDSQRDKIGTRAWIGKGIRMIWFMTPDLPEASGGLQVIYAMVETLERNGLPARVWHGSAGTSYESFVSKAPVHHALAITLVPGDILVMQETGGTKWRKLAGDLPVVKLVQGFGFVFDDLDADTNTAPGYPGWPNVRTAIVVSDYIGSVVRAMSGDTVDVVQVPPTVDDALFSPKTKTRTIAYMPRRRSSDLTSAIQLLRRSGELPEGWKFRPIEGLDHASVADVLSTSAIFLSGAQREGFGLPGAEAMAAGCYVVGFTGDGGREYLTDDVASVIHDNDVLGMAAAIAAAARAFDEVDPVQHAKIVAGRARVREKYSGEATADALVSAFTQVLSENSPSLIRSTARVEHYQAYAPRPGAMWALYRQARHLARRAVDGLNGA